MMSLSGFVLVTPLLHGSTGVGGKTIRPVELLPLWTNLLALHLLSSRSPALPPGLAPPDRASQNAAVDPDEARNWQLDDAVGVGVCAKAFDEADSNTIGEASTKDWSTIVEARALASRGRALQSEQSK
jgi:hypothetical protein